MTWRELRENYHKVGEYWQDKELIKLRWEIYEHNKYGEDVLMVVTDGNRYVFTEETLEYTVLHLEDEYEVHYFDEEERVIHEDKVKIVAKLQELINLTRMGEVELEYKTDYQHYTEAVLIYHNGRLEGVANVACDSGVALIRDVLRNDYFN